MAVAAVEAEGANATANDDHWLAGYALCIYRLIRANVGEYKSQLADRIGTQLKSITASAPAVTDVVDLYKAWSGDKGYNTLVAAFDMFFFKFPLHPRANLRIATTGTRHRDCSGILAYGFLMKLLGFPKLTDVMDWVFLEQIGDDIDRMMDNTDELNLPYSYFPYHVDMGLVAKSAYSASANPHFFEWSQIIGALLRAPRSMHARHICEYRVLDIIANAACVAYAYANNFEFAKVYSLTGEPLANDDEDEEDDESDVRLAILKSRDPTAWCTMIRACDGQMPPEVKQHVRKIVLSIKEPREGSIDEHLVSSAHAFL